MKNKLTFVAVLLIVSISCPTFGQEDLSLKYASTIQGADLKKHLTYLASDELKGRDTGSEGQKTAAEYLVNFYKEKT
ncbi:aminopeptidase [Cyclobacterium qasimii M12-11B]|uniref:Aminopeptidase n=1 Tax=Cyclobacterium qasimii M12-11B TaxID=641524 RepID=S7WXJ6_9BACT|nr:aminopeptidase [Cyclobacterium qasimii M12-11B]